MVLIIKSIKERNMHVISHSKIKKFYDEYLNTKNALESFYKIIKVTKKNQCYGQAH